MNLPALDLSLTMEQEAQLAIAAVQLQRVEPHLRDMILSLMQQNLMQRNIVAQLTKHIAQADLTQGRGQDCGD